MPWLFVSLVFEFSWFSSVLMFPLFIPGGSCYLSISFIICSPYSCISFGLYFSNSPGFSYSPVALLLSSLVKLFADVISSFNGLGSLVISASFFETSFRRIQLFILRCHCVLLLIFLYYHLLSDFEIAFCITPLQYILDVSYSVYFTYLPVDFPFPMLL